MTLTRFMKIKGVFATKLMVAISKLNYTSTILTALLCSFVPRSVSMGSKLVNGKRYITRIASTASYALLHLLPVNCNTFNTSCRRRAK